ncbi:MAG: ATP-binding protein [Ruminococcus sp.]|nr:ATP-binding protein [Ruminococcus sp.]
MRAETIEKAQIMLQRERQKAIIENENRIDEVNEKIPEIKDLNQQIFNTGKKIIDIVINGKKKGKTEAQIKEEIELIKRDNISMQKKTRDLLIKYGKPSYYLDIKYICKMCYDTGYKDGLMCDCLKKRCTNIEVEEMNKHSNLKLSVFDTFSLRYYNGKSHSIMSDNLKYLKKYAEEFTPSVHSILMYGSTGLGKTHLSLAIANKVIEKGYNVVYDSIINILSKIEEEHFSYGHKTDTLETIMKADLLIIDDLGTENITKFYISTIYNIINTRINYNKPVIINTNFNTQKILGVYDERIASRITSQYKVIKFEGDDIRKKKKEKQ